MRPASNKTICETMIALRCPQRTRDNIAALAARRGKSTSELLRDLIAAALGPDDRRPPPPTLAAA